LQSYHCGERTDVAIYHIEIASQPDSKMMIFSNKKLLQKLNNTRRRQLVI